MLRCMVHLAGTVTIDNALRLMVENTLLHCFVAENGVGEEMINFLDDILYTCSFARIKSNWHN